MEFLSNSEQETQGFAEQVAKGAGPGSVYFLSGDLGAGKTAFAKGFARGLGFAGDVTSPTFTVLNVYEGGRLPLYHFDVYRLEDVSEMENIGYSDYFYGGGVCLVEWGERIGALEPRDAVHITIIKQSEKSEKFRKIIVTEANPCIY